MPIIADKRCVRCKEVKTFKEYYKKPFNPNEIRNVCKDCYKKDSKASYARRATYRKPSSAVLVPQGCHNCCSKLDINSYLGKAKVEDKIVAYRVIPSKGGLYCVHNFISYDSNPRGNHHAKEEKQPS